MSCGRPTSAIYIPRREEDGQPSEYGTFRSVVGSPEPARGLAASPFHTESEDASASRRSPLLTEVGQRPAFGRSISSSVANSARKPPDLPSSLFGLTHRDRPSGAMREWSVFQQLMPMTHNELTRIPRTPKTANTLRVRRGGTRSTAGLSDLHINSLSLPPQETMTSCEPIQSPEADVHLVNPLDEMSDDGDVLSEAESELSVDESDVPRHDGSSSSISPRFTWWSVPKVPAIPILWRNILKCSVAYFIGSLFTFNPYLSSFIADIASYGPGAGLPSPSGHMVATV